MDVSDDDEDYYADAPETIHLEEDDDDGMFAGEVAGRRQEPLSMNLCCRVTGTVDVGSKPSFAGECLELIANWETSTLDVVWPKSCFLNYSMPFSHLGEL